MLQSALSHDRAIPDNMSLPFEIRTHARYNPAGVTQLNIVPGLVAHQFDRQGVMPTLIMLAIAAPIVRVILWLWVHV